ncbi:mycolic acid cyclopropane synthetase family protein, partial [Vibrio parahaemolyticus VPTS-2010_2]
MRRFILTLNIWRPMKVKPLATNQIRKIISTRRILHVKYDFYNIAGQTDDDSESGSRSYFSIS